MLGTDPNEALAFWELARRTENIGYISDDKNVLKIENDIFTVYEEGIKTGDFSYTLTIKNENVYKLKNLLEKEKEKEATKKLVEN